MLPNGAGVHHYHICALGGIGDGVAAFAKNAPDPFGIRLILLATVGFHIGFRYPISVTPVHFIMFAKSQLLLQCFLGNHSGFVVHAILPQHIFVQS